MSTTDNINMKTLILALLASLCPLAMGIPGNFCYLPSEVGMCRASFSRYFYNSETQACEQFIYGGCGGNKNNFRTMHECQASCPAGIPPKSNENFCYLPSEVGMCKASFPRYFYNSETQACEQFIYGGCGGNKNNFMTMLECQASCSAGIPPAVDICMLDPETGMCDAYFPSFFYNHTSQKCESFIFGGCGGNANRFATEQDCMNRCEKSSTSTADYCSLEPEVGFCKALIFRYYYDPSAGTCLLFGYGGCGGNQNNFGTKAECLSTCGTA